MPNVRTHGRKGRTVRAHFRRPRLVYGLRQTGHRTRMMSHSSDLNGTEHYANSKRSNQKGGEKQDFVKLIKHKWLSMPMAKQTKVLAFLSGAMVGVALILAIFSLLVNNNTLLALYFVLGVVVVAFIVPRIPN